MKSTQGRSVIKNKKENYMLLKLNKVNRWFSLKLIEGSKAKPKPPPRECSSVFRRNSRWEVIKAKRTKYTAMNPRLM